MALAGPLEEAEGQDADDLSRQEFVLATAIAPDITVEELTLILADLRDSTELRPG